MLAVDMVLTAGALALLLPTVVLLVEVVAAARVRPPLAAQDQARPSVAVVIPAHNERLLIGATVDGLISQIGLEDRLLVVADNCTDDTAAIARAHGAEVVERQDQNRLGKGFALQHGVDHLAAAQPPEVVIIMDADCQVGPGVIDLLARESHRTGRPAQASYIMVAAGSRRLGQRLSEFAIRLKNHVRPLGCNAIGVPCPMTGSGMAVPWPMIRAVKLGTDNIVEDMALGIDLAVAGYLPLFVPAAVVTSPLPGGHSQHMAQRMRWEQGHLSMLVKFVPILFMASVQQMSWPLMGAALDLCIPPLAVLVLGMAALTSVATVWVPVGGGWQALLLCSLLLSIMAAAITLAWRQVGRQLVSVWELAYVPVYIAKKAPIYMGLILGKRVGWVRSARD
jgi:cellulose synthase/poly-beta-1,6-N-acetylglucosamine synthase-like glycosyltransferase